MAMGRRCFVTVGATASFLKLLEEILEPKFLDCLGTQGFSELVVQTGPDHGWALKQIESLGSSTAEDVIVAKDGSSDSRGKSKYNRSRWPVIQPVPYTTDMQSLMLPCRGDAAQQRPPGAMISHAGSGSILDAMRCDLPLIVVANPDLLDNHQEELAVAVREAGWAIKGDLGHLTDAVVQLVNQTSRTSDSVPPYQEPPFPTEESERCGLFDWAAVYTDQAGTSTAELGPFNLD